MAPLSFRLLLWSISLLAVRADYQFHSIEAIEANNATSDFSWPDVSENVTTRVPFALNADQAIPLEGFTKLDVQIEVDGEKWAV
jgi:hypothetical protein